jgi:SAM-dependent methyltransferase
MSAPQPQLPLQLGSDAEFAALRTALEAAEFTEQGVCWRMNLKKVSDFPLDGKVPEGVIPKDKLGALIWLLMYGAAVDAGLAAVLPIAELRALGVVTDHNGGPVISTVMMYPARGLCISSDRPKFAGDPYSPRFADFVYPAIVPNTIQFLELLPFDACDAYLEVCAGAGLAALLAPRYGARHAWAFDITERATRFAEFNRRLNGISQVTTACGDLYQPAGDLTFDRIVAHPPYVPVFREEFVFNSGGLDGEQVVRGLIQGLPKHLRPGGRFYSLTLGSNRELPFEERVRQWLGDAQGEFDIALVSRRHRSPEDYTTEVVLRRGGSVDDLRIWRQQLRERGVRDFVYGFLTVQRRAQERPVFTVRRQVGSETTPADHARLVEWETSIATHGAAPILNQRPRTRANVKLRTDFHLTPDGWVPDGYQLQSEHPFMMDMQGQAWTAQLLASADGTATAAELLEKLKAAGSLHPDTPPEEYARLLATMVSGGFLELL